MPGCDLGYGWAREERDLSAAGPSSSTKVLCSRGESGDLLTDWSRFWGVFWIDVSTTEVAERSFVDLAQKLSLPAHTLDEACVGLANLKHPWLLVLDNADDPEIDYRQYFPDGSLGVVILTSRNVECQQYATAPSIALEGLSDEEARELLLKAAGVPPARHGVLEKDARVVAGLLQSHPLALIQAGAYVSRGHCTFFDYPAVYEQQRRRLLEFRPAQARSRYRDVYATFEASADILKNSVTEGARDALQLLPLLAVCGPSRLPLLLFEAGWRGAKTVPSDMKEEAEDDNVLLLTSWHVAHLPSLLNAASTTWDSFRLVEAVQLLKAFSLVSSDSHEGSVSVSMHSLVHAWARDRQNKDEQHGSWLQMGCVTSFARQDDNTWKNHERQLQPHVEAMMAWDMDGMFANEPATMVTRVLTNCGWLLCAMRSDAKLFTLLEKMCAHLNLDGMQVDERWLGIYNLMGSNLINHGKVKEAVSMLEHVVKVREQSQEEEHPHRLASQHALASAYLDNKQVDEAVRLLEHVVKIKEQSLREEHPNRLASQHELARAYLDNKQVDEAVRLLEHVVKIKEQSLREEHPSRLASQHELARAYLDNKQVDEAVRLLEHVVKIREQSLREEHPDRLASQHGLAICMWQTGNYVASYEMMAKVVEIRRQVLHETHMDRKTSEESLAYFRDEMAELELAVH